MQTLKLAINNNCLPNFPLGKEIGFGGSDGQVFEIINDQNKVLKLSVIYEHNTPINVQFNQIEKSISYLRETRPSAYARVFEFAKLKDFVRKTDFGYQNCCLYYYIMDKCFKITDDERKVFHTIISHEDCNIEKNYSKHQINEILIGLSLGLNFDHKKISMFYDQIFLCPINHNDLHPRNIMKDQFGNFCLVDFDRCKIK